MDAVDVNRTLDSCKKYLDEAGNEINLLESHIASEMKSFAMKTAAMTSGFGTLLMIGGGRLRVFRQCIKHSLISMHFFVQQYSH